MMLGISIPRKGVVVDRYFVSKLSLDVLVEVTPSISFINVGSYISCRLN